MNRPHQPFLRISGLQGNREVVDVAANAAIKALKEFGFTVKVMNDSIPVSHVRPRAVNRGGPVQRTAAPEDPLIYTLIYTRPPKVMENVDGR